MASDEVTTTAADSVVSRPEFKSVFTEPIQATAAQRQLDRRILESYDASLKQAQTIAIRVAKIETHQEAMSRDLQRLEESHKEIAGHLERTAHHMSALANKLAIHTDLEEVQWTEVREATSAITAIGTALNAHLQHAAQVEERMIGIEKAVTVRLNWHERFLTFLGGVAFVVTIAVIGLGTKIILSQWGIN